LIHRAAILVLSIGLTAPAVLEASDRAPSLPVLTRIQAIRALSQDEGGRGYPVRILATVTHFDRLAARDMIVHDGELGQFVIEPTRAETLSVWRTLETGDLVQIEGRTLRGGFAPNVQPDVVRKVGRAALPAPRHIPYSALLSGRHDCDYVEVTGVVQRAWVPSDPQVRTMFAEVAVEEGVVRVSFWDYAATDLGRFVDARVRIRGNVGTIFGHTEQLRGVSLFAGHARDISVLEPAPDPFQLTVRSIRSIYNYSPWGEVNRRIRVRGVVTAQIPGSPVEVSDFSTAATFRYVRHVLYVEDGTGGARIETEQPPTVRPGQLVEAAGFAAVTPGKPILRNAVFRIVGTNAEPTPLDIASRNVFTAENDAELVRVQAQLLSVLSTPTERVLVLKVGQAVFDAGLVSSEEADALSDIRPGSLVSVTGVYSYQWGPPPSFRLFLRSPADVLLVSAAPWWTLRHTAVMTVILALVATGGAVWIRMVANRKQREYQAVLAERSRVARELHDTLEQGLAGIALQLEAVAGSLETSPETVRQSLDVARQMLRYSLEETRRSIRDLRSQALESRDLAGALTKLARQMTLGTGARAEVRVEGAPQRLDAAQEHHLLRIGLEALTNALKHASARQIDIELRFQSHQTDLLVRDDGRGLGHGAEDMPGAHFGLQGIRERVDKLGGVLKIDSRPGEGTQLLVTIPHRQSVPLYGERRAV
jgi:signal transduction histidine kinase